MTKKITEEERVEKVEENGLTVKRAVSERHEVTGSLDRVRKRVRVHAAYGKMKKSLRKKFSQSTRKSISLIVESFFLALGVFGMTIIAAVFVLGVYPPIALGVLSGMTIQPGLGPAGVAALTLVPSFMIGALIVGATWACMKLVWGVINTRRKHLRYFFVPEEADTVEENVVTRGEG